MRDTAPEPQARTLGRAETFFWFMGQANCGNAMIAAELAGELPAERIESALRRAQVRHPMLRARIERKGLRMALEVETDPAPIPVRDGHLAAWRAEVAAELDRPFAVGAAPLVRCLVFRGDGPEAALALVYCHAVCDGLGSASLMSEVLADATGDRSPSERPPLPLRPPLEELVRPASRGVALRFFSRRFRVWLQRGLPRRLPGFRDVTFRSRDVRILSRQLSGIEATALLEACRAERATVNGALAAALLGSLAEELPGDGRASLTLSSPVDLRPSSSPEVGRTEVGDYIGHVVTTHRVRPAPGFWEQARECNAELRRSVADGDGLATWLALPPPWSALPQALWGRFLCALMRVQPPSAMLTNLGRVAAVHLDGGVAVRTLSFGLSPIFRDALALCACSHGGILALNLVFAARALPRERAERVAERLHATLREVARARLALPVTAASSDS